MAEKSISTQRVDIIEKMVYEHIKSLGFKKHGRTLHRFVDGDISQLICFQNGCPVKGVFDILTINIGIRVPECYERKFVISEPLKKYYHDYECNIRNHLGNIVYGNDSYYELPENPEKIGLDIIEKIQIYVLPFFEELNNRDAILKKRREFSNFDLFNHLIVLEEAMIYGRKGDVALASKLFNEYYQEVLDEYNYKLEFGSKTYMYKGQQVTYLNTKTKQTETLTATEDGYLQLFNANRGHLSYLEDLANELGVILK